MTTYYLDFEGGNDGNDGTSYANRRRTLTDFTAGDLAPGDTIRIMASPAATSLGQTAAWTDLSPTVTLNSAVTANISLCQAAWTASANVTTTTSTTRKEGTVSTQIVLAAGFTTGLAAYEATGAIDLSAYQQVSFWIRQSAGTQVAAGDITLRLCSDTIGAVSVQTITVPAIPANAEWLCVTVDTGGALPVLVNSVALYVATDSGAQTFQIDNIIACKASASADSLTLNSLIGKNADDGLWWPIRSINGTTVTIDTSVNSSAATTARGYSGTSETVTTYKREPIRQTPTNGSFAVLNDSGTSGSVITLSGGWNRTDMSTQTDETWVSNAFGGSSIGLDLTTMSYVTCEKLSFGRYNTCISISTGVNNTFGSTCHVFGGGNSGLTHTSQPSAEQVTALDFGYAYCCSNGIVSGGSPGYVFGTVQGCLSNSISGVSLNTVGVNRVIYIVSARNNGSTGVILGSAGTVNARIKIGSAADNGVNGVNVSGAGGRIFIYDSAFSGNATSSVALSAGALVDLQNCTLSDATEFSGATAGAGARARSQKHDATADNHYIWDHLGVIQSEGTVRHTASGIAWKMSPTTTVAVSNAPLTLSIAKVACAASAQVTFKAFLRRTNTGLTHKIVCRGGQIGGVASDVSASMTAAADTWEELTLTFTPNEAGVVEIEAQCYGGTTYSGYVDDQTITQA